MVRFDIKPGKTALVIIDMQNAFLEPGAPFEIPEARSLVPKLNKLVRACRRAGIWVIFVRNVFRKDGRDLGLFTEFVPSHATASPLFDGAPGAELYSEVDSQDGDTVVTKHAYSAFVGTDLDLLLRANRMDTLIIGGVQTNVCCEATARDARHRDYRVIFLSDGTATKDLPDVGWGALPAEQIQRSVLTLMAFRYAEVLSVAQVLRRMRKTQTG